MSQEERIEKLELAVLLLCETLLIVFQDLHPVLGRKQKFKYEQIAAGLHRIRNQYQRNENG